MLISSSRGHRLALACCTPLLLSTLAGAQVSERAAFVGNNGNLEGAVTSFTFSPAGEPQFVQHLVLGSGSGHVANNAYSLTLSPDGRHLAVTHVTGQSPQQISILRIHEDATMTLVGRWSTHPSPMHAQWINDEYLAVTMSRSSSSVDSRILVYRFDEEASSSAGKFMLINGWVAGDFCTYFSIHPNRQYLYAEDGNLGGPTSVRIFQINPTGTLTVLHTEPTSGYMLGLNVSPNGRWLFGGGGAMGGGANTVSGYAIDETTGLLIWNGQVPSSGSPKQTVVSNDNRFLFVGHGSSGSVRSFEIDQATGALTDTGNLLPVGGQGDLGNIAMLDDMVLFTRQYGSTAHGPAGLLSYTIQQDGSFTLNGFAQAGATRPFDIATWSPPETFCYANCDASTTEPILNVEDFTCFINEFAGAQSLPHEQQISHYANCDGSTTAPVLNVEDFTCFINAFANGCP